MIPGQCNLCHLWYITCLLCLPWIANVTHLNPHCIHVPVYLEAVVELFALAVHMLMGVRCRITNAGLPSGLARLPYLKSIGLKRNCLTSVPRMLGQMHSLQEIYLEDNNELEVWRLL